MKLHRLDYQTNRAQVVSRSDGFLPRHIIGAVAVIVAVVFALLFDHAAFAVAGVVALMLAFDLITRMTDETVFLVDQTNQRFIVQRRSFGRVTEEQTFSLANVNGFKIEKVEDGRSRIVVVIDDSAVPLHPLWTDDILEVRVREMNAMLKDAKT